MGTHLTIIIVEVTYYKRKGHPSRTANLIVNLKSNTMKNTVQI